MMRRNGAARRRVAVRAAAVVAALAVVLVLTATLRPAPRADAGGRADARGQAYAFSATRVPRRVLHWPAGRPIRVYVAGGSDPVRARRLMGAFRAAAADWEAAADGRVRFRTTDRIAGADVVVAWAASALPIDTGGCQPLRARVAVTTFCANEEWTRLEPFPLRPPHAGRASPVRMLVTLRPRAAPTLKRAQQLLAHELGHVLGLARHSPSPDDLMWGGPLTALHPSSADRTTVRALYRAPADILP